jgi:hypothetical protein
VASEALINKCRKFNKKVANIISLATPALSKFKAINWLAPAKTNIEKDIAGRNEIPPAFANNPNAIAIGKYPIKIGKPVLMPVLKPL